jgi:hypothetical protein
MRAIERYQIISFVVLDGGCWRTASDDAAYQDKGAAVSSCLPCSPEHVACLLPWFVDKAEQKTESIEKQKKANLYG